MMGFSEEDRQGPVIRDRRRIDPVTGQVRDAERPAGQGPAGPSQRGGPGQARPGKHAVSKPGGAAEGSPRANPDAVGGTPGGSSAGGPSAGSQGNGPTAGAAAPRGGAGAAADGRCCATGSMP